MPAVGGRRSQQKSRRFLAEIIEPRVEEIFVMIGEEVRRRGYEEHISSGVVLTGGTSKLPGIEEVGTHILGIPVRRGEVVETDPPLGGVTSAASDPSYAVALGMVLLGARQGGSSTSSGTTQRNGLSRFKKWLREAFV